MNSSNVLSLFDWQSEEKNFPGNVLVNSIADFVPHHSEKPDSDQHKSEKPDPDPHQSFFLKTLFALGGSPTPHPISSRPHFVCKFSRQRSTEVF